MTATPILQRYTECKAAAGDALLLFRMGDFYELFYADAETAAKTLGLTLTRRNSKSDTGPPIPMCGFPYHVLDSYIGKLVASGYRVAVCEQTKG